MSRSIVEPIQNCLRKYSNESGLKQTEVAKFPQLRSTDIISRREQGVSMPSVMNGPRLAILFRTMISAFSLDKRWAGRKELKL